MSENKSTEAGIKKPARRKNIGYLAPQYYHVDTSEYPPEIDRLLDGFTAEAAHIEQPDWYVKYAAVYFTYQGKHYVVRPGRLDCSGEVFERLADDMIDRLYELGAYDMFYSGMLD